MRKIGVGYITEDGDGKNFKVNIHVYSIIPETTTKDGATIVAHWLSSQNRVTPPRVYKGETVEVFATENSDIYYWKPVHYETDLRCHESATYAWSNKKENDKAPLSADNTHSLTVDATNKLILLSTATNRGEKTGYSISLNLKDGIFLFKDTMNHVIKLDSPNKTLSIAVENIKVKCETYSIDASKSITFKTPKFNIRGGAVTNDSTLTQNKQSTLNAPLTQNSSSILSSQASTTPGPDGHTHKVL